MIPLLKFCILHSAFCISYHFRKVINMANYPSTPHLNVQNEIGFGKTVLMPGDPLRAKFIAENFLENPVLVNGVRGVYG